MNSHSWLQLTKTHNLTLDAQALGKLFSKAPDFDKKNAQRSRKVLKALQKNASPETLLQLLNALQPGTDWLPPKQCQALTIADWNLTLKASSADSSVSPRFLAVIEAQSSSFDRKDHAVLWKSSPNARLLKMLHACQAPFGLLVNSNTLRLLHRPANNNHSFIEWPIQQSLDQPMLLKSFLLFVSLANQQQAKLEQFLQEAQSPQSPLTRSLRSQIKRAFECLFQTFCQDFDHSPVSRFQEQGGEITNQKLQEMFLVILMRVLFLLYAEQTALLPSNDPVYASSYSLHKICHSLNNHPNPDFPDFSHDAWLQFLATSKLLFHGCHHPRLNLIPYGGQLFNPERFPILDQWKVRNRDLHAVLQSLLFSPNKKPISLKHLDVEQMGYLYEGLLEIEITGLPGERKITPSSHKRNSGTYYTPRSLTGPLVEKTLAPLTTLANGQLCMPKDILALRICDLTAGSGAFLVQITRFLSDALVKSWQGHAARLSNAFIPTLPYALPMDDPHNQTPLPLDNPEEMLICARRLIVERCIYGVDINPLAIEIARLSLWILSLSKHRPFTFLDHSLKTGNSLLGTNLGQLQSWSLTTTNKNPLLEQLVDERISKALINRQKLTSITVHSPEDLAFKQQQCDQSNHAIAKLKLASNLLLSTSIYQPNEVSDTLSQFTAAKTPRDWRQLELREAENIRSMQPFHWPLEFPEVFLDPDHPGFHAIIANPPFQGGQKLSATIGNRARGFLVEHIADGVRGSADLSAYFLRKAYSLLAPGGNLGIIVTNSISDGHSKKVALDPIVKSGATIYSADTSKPWPGSASLDVTTLHIHKGPWTQSRTLNGKDCSAISSSLDQTILPRPKRISALQGLSFQGSIPVGEHFIICPKQATDWLLRNPKLAAVLFPYLTGKDLNQSASLTPSRWIINFHDWPEERAKQYPECYQHLKTYVKPVREKSKNRHERLRWWLHSAARRGLYSAIKRQTQTLVRSRISNLHILTFVPASWVYSDGIVVIATEEPSALALLQSGVHETWARRHSSSLRRDMRYSSTEAFQTFPWPHQKSKAWTQLRSLATALENKRRQLMSAGNLSLQKLYKVMHKPVINDLQTQKLRSIHKLIDHCVLKAYHWEDLIAHDSHQHQRIGKESFFTFHESIRGELLLRLSRLNHERC
jgi:hypothetical protein